MKCVKTPESEEGLFFLWKDKDVLGEIRDAVREVLQKRFPEKKFYTDGKSLWFEYLKEGKFININRNDYDLV